MVTAYLESTVSSSIDIYEIGNPNANAEGIINDAFEDKEQEPKPMPSIQMEKEEEEEEKQLQSSVMARKKSLEVCEVESNYIQPNDLRELVEPNQSVTSAEENVEADENETIEEGIISSKTNSQSVVVTELVDEKSATEKKSTDPFDTSVFDSEAFDAFETRFEATDIHHTDTTHGVDDPFASPYRTSKSINNNNEKNVFDNFEPFIPKQPENTPFKSKPKKKDSFEDSSCSEDDSDSDENIHIVIKAKMKDNADVGSTPIMGQYFYFSF